MDAHTYQTVLQTAEAWGVTKRYVNLCIADGRVPGALKMGKMWLVPKGAEKPPDQRRSARQPCPLSSDLVHLLEIVCISAPHKDPDSIVEAASEERARRNHEGALAYIRGDFELAKRCYEALAGDDAARLCASAIAIAAAMSTGDYAFFLEIETFLKGIVQAEISPEATAVAEFALASGYLGAMAPAMVPEWLKNGDFSALPAPLKQDAAEQRVKYFQCMGQYESMLAVAQTALSLDSAPPGITFARTYLRLLCAVACFSLGRADEARRWLLDAMRQNLPHGFIAPFAELLPLFGGMMEQCLKREFPERHDAVTSLWKRVIANWLSFHNRFTKDNLTLILSLREYEMALLVARRLPYAKVAEQLHLSPGSLKNAMQIIYGKLCINSRAELAKLVLGQNVTFQ